MKWFLKILIVLNLVSIAFAASSPTPAAKKEDLKFNFHRGTVLSTVDASGYTYIEVKMDNETRWLATNKMELKPGQKIEFPDGIQMNDFFSKSLKRTFKTIYFLSGVWSPDSKDAEKAIADIKKGLSSPQSSGKEATPTEIKVEKGSIQKAENGLTIAEIFLQKDKIKGTDVLVRGKIVKVNREVMNRNWVHIKDGSENEKMRDLLVTTKEKVNEGDTVLFKGRISINRDFGAGYSYEILMENATLQKDQKTK